MILNLDKREIIGLLVVSLINFLLKIPFTAKGFFAFTYDQGRDFLAVAKIIYDKDLTLIGPTTGLPGIFYGPWWYYFLAPLLFFSGGDPQNVANYFGLLGLATIIALYMLIKSLTHNFFLAICLAAVASMSSFYLFIPTLIWSPTLVPILLIFFFFILSKIMVSTKSIYFFLLGVTSLLIADAGAAFGAMLTLSLLMTPLIFRKTFFRREFFLTILGAFLILLPRILFELRNNFLITKSIASYLFQPRVYGEKTPIFSRFLERIDHFWGIFSSSYAAGNKILGLLIIIFISLIVLGVLRNKNTARNFTRDSILLYGLFLLFAFLVGFSVFPDRVWDYYLVGLPIIITVIISRIMARAFDTKNLRLIVILFLIILVVLNFNRGLVSPFKISWEGDGASYRNQKKVMDYIASLNPRSYSLYAYSPAIFDYAFDYLVFWYTKKSLLEEPKYGQNLMYLIIRDDPDHTYLLRGWYGDKTKDNTTLVERKTFPGDLVVEKHLRND